MASAVAVNGASKGNPPSQTLYCRNLNDKINKQDLRRALYTLFSTVGTVLDVVALKTLKMRGQAHVVFRDASTCTQAMREMQDFNLFGQPLRLTYGHGKSNMISRLDGTATLQQETALRDKQQAVVANSIFSAPPPAASSSRRANLKPSNTATDAPSPRKRPREDEEDADQGAPMDESDDAMDESD